MMTTSFVENALLILIVFLGLSVLAGIVRKLRGGSFLLPRQYDEDGKPVPRSLKELHAERKNRTKNSTRLLDWLSYLKYAATITLNIILVGGFVILLHKTKSDFEQITVSFLGLILVNIRSIANGLAMGQKIQNLSTLQNALQLRKLLNDPKITDEDIATVDDNIENVINTAFFINIVFYGIVAIIAVLNLVIVIL